MTVDIICADARDALARFPDGHFHCCVTSPPFWGLRDYGLGPDALGLEPTPELYVEHVVSVMRDVRRVLRDDGTLWLNLGDCYASQGGHASIEDDGRQNRAMRQMMTGIRASGIGLKPKDLVGIPWMVAFALRADGWWLRRDIIWSKPNPMPESVTDRPTSAHEYLFLLTKAERYAYDQDAIREPLDDASIARISQPTFDEQEGGPKDYGKTGVNRHRSARQGLVNLKEAHERGQGRNRRSVWEIATQPFGLEMCGSCRMIYSPAQYRRLRGGSNPRCNHEVIEGELCGGTQWHSPFGGGLCLSCDTFYTAKQLERLPRAAKCRKCGSEEWLSHFAVFPEKLVEPCILTTSEWGCCPQCGAPWERLIEKGTEPHPNRWSKEADAKQFNQGDGDYGEAGSLGVAHTSTTTGWRPTCKHGAEPAPCRILDPFAGSGTVGLVAERLGRHSVLIDAKDEYCEMARHRTAQRGLMVEAK